MQDWFNNLGRRFDGGPMVMGFTLALGGFLLIALLPSTIYLPGILLLTIIASILVTVFFFTKVEYALLTFFGLRALVDMMWWVPIEVASMNIMELFSGAVAGLAMVMFFATIKRFDNHPVMPPFLVYFLMMVIGALRALEFREMAEIMARYLSIFFLMFLVTVNFDTRKKRLRLFILISAVSLIPIAISSYHLALGHIDYYLDGYYRLIGGYKNLHNHALMMMFFTILWGFWAYNVHPKRAKLIPLTFAAMAGAALVFTYVRTAWMGLAITAVIFFYAQKDWRFIILILIAGVFLVATSQTVQDRFIDFIKLINPDPLDVDRQRLGSGRWGTWGASLEVYFSQPIASIVLGMGMGQHKQVTEEFLHMYRRTRMDPHSDYISLLVQAGPVGVIAYLVAEWQVAKYALRLRTLTKERWIRSFANLMIGLSVLQVFANTVSNAFIIRTTINWYFWCLAGMCFAEYNAIVAQQAKTPAPRAPTVPPPLPIRAPRFLRPGGPRDPLL